MADTKASALTELAGADLADADLLYVVDTSASTSKKIQAGNTILRKFTLASSSGAASLDRADGQSSRTKCEPQYGHCTSPPSASMGR